MAKKWRGMKKSDIGHVENKQRAISNMVEGRNISGIISMAI